MIIEQLSESILKITLEFSEFSVYNLNKDNITASSPEIKKFIVFAIRRASRETGFEASGSNIKIESVPNNAGLVFFITKLNDNIQKNKTDDKSKMALEKICASSGKNRNVYFIFTGKKSLVEFLYATRNEDFSYARLYTMSGKYYLKLPVQSKLYNHALEFSNPAASQILTLRLAKDGLLICRGEDFNKIL